MPRLRRAGRIVSRITGFSTPVGGVQWEPPTLERDVLRKLLVELEDKRALYTDYTEEDQTAVYRSIEDIRRLLTQAKSDLSEDSKALTHVIAMRAACRQYFDELGKLSRGGSGPYHVSFPDFYRLLGAFRALIGLQIYTLCQLYDIQVEDRLASIFPPERE